MADLALVPRCPSAQGFLILSQTMSASPSNCSSTYKAFPRELGSLSVSPCLAQRAVCRGSSFLKVCLLLSLAQMTWGLPPTSPSGSSPSSCHHSLWKKVSLECSLQFAFHCPVKLPGIFLAPLFPWHEHQFIDHWATRLWNASAWLNVTTVCMSRGQWRQNVCIESHQAGLSTKESTSWQAWSSVV